MAASMESVRKLSQRVLRGFTQLSKTNNQRQSIFWRMQRIPKLNFHQLFNWTSLRCRQTATVVGGSSLAFLGFSFTKEELSEKDQIRRIVSKGIVAKQLGNIAEASRAFHEALMQSTDFLDAKKITEKDHMNHRVFIYDQIANLCLETGDFKTAEMVFKDTMKLALQLGMAENDNAMIEMSLKLSTIYLYTGRKDLAVIGLQHCIKEQEMKLEKMEVTGSADKAGNTAEVKEEEDNVKVLLGKAFKHLANYHLQVRDFKQAESLMQKALEISKSVLGDNDDNTFVIMNDIATCQIMLKEYEKAENLLNEGITLSGKANSLMQSALLSNLGALYIRTNRFTQAQSACERGLKVAEKGKDEFLKGPCRACLERLAQIKSAEEKKKTD